MQQELPENTSRYTQAFGTDNVSDTIYSKIIICLFAKKNTRYICTNLKGVLNILMRSGAATKKHGISRTFSNFMVAHKEMNLQQNILVNWRQKWAMEVTLSSILNHIMCSSQR
jgi:hypothetical protein